jgi:hypothetical protein
MNLLGSFAPDTFGLDNTFKFQFIEEPTPKEVILFF